MPSCPFVQRIHQSKGEKVLKSGAFKNDGIHEPGKSFKPAFSAN
jgi:hypothetical protein